MRTMRTIIGPTMTMTTTPTTQIAENESERGDPSRSVRRLVEL
jgi:hypothetical protein